LRAFKLSRSTSAILRKPSCGRSLLKVAKNTDKAVRAGSSLYANYVDEAFRKGKLRGLWAFSVTRNIRIIFEFLNGDEVLFHDIGPHTRVY
jgi:mRNA-degrading endonuclease YafQ of YafQ-DinJ toxin-antitoxin module